MGIREYELYQLNSFAEGEYLGNPAGVCLLGGSRDEAFYRRVAAVMGLSETAFAYPEGEGYQLRWYTPNGTEVDLCGHATLATAAVLFGRGRVAGNEVRFNTRSGELIARLSGGDIWLDFPAEEVMGLDGDRFRLDEALGARSVYTGRTRFDAFLEFPSEDVVRGLAPDFGLLKQVPGRGVIVTARAAGDGYDFVSRFFCPKLGMDEDPVTGSAHCALAVYWGYVLGRTSLTGRQVSSRGGIVRTDLEGDRVRLSGRTVEVPVPPEKLARL
jgi:predicted PhzF superfamily epimerase YddE/YHI9